VDDLLSSVDGIAGIAAVINGLLLWPIVRALKNVTKDHGDRIAVLETKTNKPARARPRRKPST
jgi:hypothetical protein